MNPDPASMPRVPVGVVRQPRRGITLVRFAVLTLASRLWRGLFWPRGIADLDDRQLADIGLKRSDVPRRGADGAAEAETAARLRRGGW